MSSRYKNIILHSLPYLLALLGIWRVLTAWRAVSLDDGVIPAVTQSQFEARVQVVIGLGILVAAAWLFARQFPLTAAPKPFLIPPNQERVPFYRTFWVISLVGAGSIILLGLWISPQFQPLGISAPKRDNVLPNYTQLAMFLGGSFLWIIGFMNYTDPRRIWDRLTQSLHTYPREWLLVFMLTLAALAVRLYRLDTAIPIMVSDESAYLVAGQRVLSGQPLTISSDMHFGDLYLGAYIISLWFKVVDPTLFTGRLTVAIMGALVIPGLYLLTRRFFGWKAAWLACMFLITQPLHVHFSRIAIYNMYDLTMGVFATLLLWDGLERGGRWKFALAGVLVGIAQYYYAGSLIWLVLIPLWLVVEFLRHPRPVFSHWANLLLMVFSAILMQFPMYAYFEPRNLSPLQHSANMSAGEGDLDGIFDENLDFYFNNLSRAVRAYVDLGDTTRHFQPGGITQINSRWASLVFLLGLAVISRYALHPGLLYLLMWMGLMLILGGAIMRDTPGYSRYTVITVPLAALAGIGLMWFLQRFQALLAQRRHIQIFAAGLLVMVAINVADFHLIQGEHNQLWLDNASASRIVSYTVAMDAVAIAQEGSVPVFVLRADDDIYTDRFRLLEVFQYHCGMACPYEELTVTDPTQDLTYEWLAGLQQDNDVYVYILPISTTSIDPEAPPFPESPATYILSAYPEAHFQRATTERYQLGRQFALYTLVRIPARANFQPSGQLQFGG